MTILTATAVHMKVTVTTTLAGANMLIISPLARGVVSVCATGLAVYMKLSLMKLTQASARTLAGTRSGAWRHTTEGLIDWAT